MNYPSMEKAKEFMRLQEEYLSSGRTREWIQHPLYQKHWENERRWIDAVRPDMVPHLKRTGVY